MTWDCPLRCHQVGRGSASLVICQQVPIDKVQLGYWMAREPKVKGIRIEVRLGFQKETFSTEY